MFALLQHASQMLQERYRANYNWMICDITYLMFGPALYGISKGLYGHAIWPLIVFATSQLRWRDPIDWKDRVDRLAVACTLAHHLVSAWSAPTGTLYVFFTGCGILLYFLGLQLHKLNMPFESHLAHAGLHFFANIGNLMLYMGL